MKNKLVSLIALAFMASFALAQVSTSPAFIPIGYDGEITITFNPNEGNGGMIGATQCYAHSGVTLKGKGEWQHVQGSWRSYPDKMKLTKNQDGNWILKITPNIKEFYGLADHEVATGLSFVFNDGKINGTDGTHEGKTAAGGDIFVNFIEPTAGLKAKINTPSGNQLLDGKQTLTIEGAASKEAQLTLLINGKEVKTQQGTLISYSQEFTEDSKVLFTATADGKTIADSIIIAIMYPSVSKTRPQGIQNGIYYNPDDFTQATLCTYAASKTQPAKAVYVVGDFNNWAPSAASQMYQDGNYFWLTLTDLQPQKEYAFQYLVVRADGKMVRISDLFSTKLLHPDDKYEPKTVDPELINYPQQGDGYVSVLQTNKPQFQWSDETLNFQRPDKNNLVIYELWVYDYTAERSIPGLILRLDYLQQLGINAIELMPICEFDGNYNWGYSPNHYFAPDRAYGSETMYKQLIDECHKRGIAVILDMVFNHATGLNPMCKLYPYGNDLKDNPWFCTNDQVPHDDNVYEHWNHDFQPAKDMFTRALNFWIQEYHIDGYRMDLSHGLCGCGTKANYDYQKLMDNLTHYYNNGVLAAADIQKNGEPYFILEHWGPKMTTQRPQLVKQGMLCWDNNNNAYSQLAMGYTSSSNLNNSNRDGYVSYCESHDEERNYYKAKTWGAGIVKTDEEARLNRVPATIAFSILLNGPQMIWQYNELGFDYSINSTVWSDKIDESNRTSKKARPEWLGWFHDPLRMKQYQTVGKIIQLRTKLLPNLFQGNPNSTGTQVANGFTRTISWGSGENTVFAAANFQPEAEETITLPAGTWYDYLNDNAKQEPGQITLKGGELRIFTGKQLQAPKLPESFDFYTDLPQTNVNLNQQWTAYPTFTTGKVNIISQENNIPSACLFNLQGQLVMQQHNAQSLDLTNLKSGLYILKLYKNNNSQTIKIIKQ